MVTSERSLMAEAPPPVTQVPFTAKQPALKSMPWAKVEVAFPVWLIARTLRPCEMVEEAVVEVALKASNTASPATESLV